MAKKDKKSPREGTGIAIGTVFGLALGFAFDNVGIGLALGVALGVAFEGANKKKKGG